jgi:hypothetical protein
VKVAGDGIPHPVSLLPFPPMKPEYSSVPPLAATRATNASIAPLSARPGPTTAGNPDDFVYPVT